MIALMFSLSLLSLEQGLTVRARLVIVCIWGLITRKSYDYLTM